MRGTLCVVSGGRKGGQGRLGVGQMGVYQCTCMCIVVCVCVCVSLMAG